MKGFSRGSDVGGILDTVGITSYMQEPDIVQNLNSRYASRNNEPVLVPLSPNAEQQGYPP